MMTFEQRMARMLVRIESIQRKESVLAERIRGANARGAEVTRSIEELTSQFPQVEVPAPLDGKWVLEPLSARLRDYWSARRTTIVEIESPALSRAAGAAKAEAVNIETQRSGLGQRTAGARRVRTSAQPAARWRRLFCGLAQRFLKEQSSMEPSVNLDDSLRRVATLREANHSIEQRQTDFQSLASELRRMKQLIDELTRNRSGASG